MEKLQERAEKAISQGGEDTVSFQTVPFINKIIAAQEWSNKYYATEQISIL